MDEIKKVTKEIYVYEDIYYNTYEEALADKYWMKLLRPVGLDKATVERLLSNSAILIEILKEYTEEKEKYA